MKNTYDLLYEICIFLKDHIVWFMGGYDNHLRALMLVVFVDYITGCMRAALNGCFSLISAIKGANKKALIFVLIGLATATDRYIIGGGSIARSTVFYYYFFSEAWSVIKNVEDMDVTLPTKFEKILNFLCNNDESDTK